MSTIKTLSQFFYGTTVTTQNRSIDFDEGGGELRATLKVGTYSATEYVAEWQRALRESGSQAYVCSLNRSTQRMTISAPNPFSLLNGTGSRLGTSAWTMAGFTTGFNQTGLSSYEGPNRVGKRYVCQYPVSDYVAPEHVIVKESATVNDTPAGITQQVSFGDGIRVSLNIRVITNKTGLKMKPFYENATGISDAMDFVAYLLTKGRLEFMPDWETPANFVKCYLESTREDRDAKRFILKNMKVPDFYETGVLTFRKVLNE